MTGEEKKAKISAYGIEVVIEEGLATITKSDGTIIEINNCNNSVWIKEDMFKTLCYLEY